MPQQWRYLGCKQNLGHPVNDSFRFQTDVQPPERNFECVTVKGSTVVENAHQLGIELRHGGSEHDQPVRDPSQPSLPERTDLVEVRKGHRPQSLRRCSEVGASRSDSGSQQMANQIKEPADLWDLEHYLTQRRKEIDRKYDFRYSELTHVLGRLLQENRLSEEQLHGLREDKLNSIRSFATFLAKWTQPNLDLE
jgi:hypothetical protein